MNAEIRFKDKRILEALEYIDEKYIDDVFDVLKEPIYSNGGKLKISPFKRWRYYIAAAACLLVLALAMPLFSYLPEIINSFAAGWWEGTETLEVPETTNGMYDEYILTEEDLAQINEAYMQKELDEWKNQGITLTDEQIEQIKNSKYSKYALTVDEAMKRSTDGRFYFGKYGNCVVLGITPLIHTMEVNSYELGNIKFNSHINICVVYEREWLFLPEAYQRGLFTEEEVCKLYEVYNNYFKGEKNNEKDN